MDEAKTILSILALMGVGGIMFYFVSIFATPKKDVVIDNTKEYDEERKENETTVNKQTIKQVSEFFKKFRWIFILCVFYIGVGCSHHIIFVISEPPVFPELNPEAVEESKILIFQENDAKKLENFLLDIKAWREMVKKSLYDFKEKVEK